MARRMSLLAVLLIVGIAAAGYGAMHYMTSMPGKPHIGALPPLTPEEAALVQSLKRHIATIAAREHNLAHYDEPPYFRTEAMGSMQYARALARRNERVIAMYSLETIGFYSSAPGSQIYPAPFGLMFPDRGDFVAFVGMLGSRTLVRKTIRSFRSHTAFPTIGGVAPGFVPGIGWSDHWAFAEHGFEAVMITDTAA